MSEREEPDFVIECSHGANTAAARVREELEGVIADLERQRDELLEAARQRISKRHSDTCLAELIEGEECSCGHDALVAAIEQARGGGDGQ